MSGFKTALVWALSVIFMSSFAYAGVPDNLAASDHTHTKAHKLELKPIPSQESYQLAKSTFLPDTSDDLGFSGRESINNHNQGDECSAYNLTSCPYKGNCKKCPFNNKKLKLTSCASGWYVNNNSCSPSSCGVIDPSYKEFNKSNIPNNYICSPIYMYGRSCYSNCRPVNCGSYPANSSYLTRYPDIKTCSVCPDCQSTHARCTPYNYCKVTACNNNKKPNTTGTGCIAKDDNCPSGTAKNCPYGISSNAGTTEAGSPCYTCKACSLRPCFTAFVPQNATGIQSSCTDCSGTRTVTQSWICNSGYIKSGIGCICAKTCTDTVSSKPENSYFTSDFCSACGSSYTIKSGWACNSGYTKSGNSCVCSTTCTDKLIFLPAHSHYTYQNCSACGVNKTIKSGWECDSGYSKGNGIKLECVPNCTPLSDETNCRYGTHSCSNGCGGERTCCNSKEDYDYCVTNDCDLETNCYSQGLSNSYCQEKYPECERCCRGEIEPEGGGHCYYIF